MGTSEVNIISDSADKFNKETQTRGYNEISLGTRA